MRKATVTYVAPPGDARDVIMGGVHFHDGKPVEINSYDNPHLMSKLQGSNALFDVEMGKEDDSQPPKVKRGRPSAADVAAAKAAAEQAERDEKAAKEKTEAAKSDLEKITNPKDTETTRPAAEGKKADVKAGMAAATAHDFEKDRQAEVARRDAQAKGIGSTEQGTMQTKPMTYPPGQSEGLTPGNPPGGQQPKPDPAV
jgi:hypothetical protein